MRRESSKQAYLIGGGIASLAAAVYLIRDGKMRGEDIHILEEGGDWGGSLDAGGTPERGYVMRGGRMFEERFVCTYDLLSGIPSYDNPEKSARDDIFDFFKEAGWFSRTRLIGRNGERLDVSTMGFSPKDRFDLLRLTLTPERLLGARRIDQAFGKHFFNTNFWYMWCSMFAFEPWHSAVEMRRYLLRFLHQFPMIADLSGIYHTRYSQYHSMVVPIQRWLQERKVDLQPSTEVLDLEFARGKNLMVREILYRRAGKKSSQAVEPEDLVIVTNGSMTAASSLGTMSRAAVLNRENPGASWNLWERLASKRAGLGNPRKFTADIEKSKWLSFTVTTTDPQFRELMEKYTGNELGRGGLITFRDSRWLMTINLHHNPVYPGQPEGTYIWWGYGLFPDKTGDFVKKKMAACNGAELLAEAFGHLQLPGAERLIRNSQCIPCMMPYITSQFMPRNAGDRPAVVPKNSVNLAFVGQYCELPEDTVFTVEYSVRAAKVAVTKLLKLKEPVPPVYQGKREPRVLVSAFREALKG
jgi:oleate hydratase